MSLSPIPCLLALIAILSLGACGSTGMMRVEPASEPGAATGPGTMQPPPEPEPEPEPEPPPPCIPTHDGSCISAEDFQAETESLATEYGEHVNFENQWGLGHVKADYAYGHLRQIMGEDVAPGAGVTIGFIDSGIDQGHPDFDGKKIAEYFLPGARDENGFRSSHGTAVASVAAARRSLHHYSAHGVAWAADIAMFAIPVGSGGGPYVPIPMHGLAAHDPRIADWFNVALVPRPGAHIDILNLSIGLSGVIDSYSEQDLRSNFWQAIAAMAQADAEEKTILVWAAGNAHGDPCFAFSDHCENGKINAVSVEVLPGLVARIAELQGHSIAVVALRPDGTIADFSNRCGIAADYCIAAPGEGMRVAYFGPHEVTGAPARGYGFNFRGTSFAAPMVAGGLAVMKQLFRDQLSNTELVTRLFETADDEGVYADRAVYGHGAMDLRAATWPVGVLDVPVESDRADGAGASLLGTRLQAGAAFGDGLERSMAGTEIAAFDDLGAPFWFDLGDFTAGAAARSMAADVHESPAPAWSRTGEAVRWRLGYREPPGDGGDGHLALVDRAVTLTLADRHALRGTVFTTEGAEQPPASGAAVAWRPAGSPLGLHAGWVHERETLLGSSADGAFGALSADAAFVGVEADAELGGWRIGADAEVGTVNSAARGGIVTGVSPLTTTAFTLHASTAFAGDGSLRLSVSQPLRVERGSVALSVPAGRTKAGAVVRSPLAAELAPSGRQIDVSARWQQPLSVGEVSLGAIVTHQPGHRAAADPELMFLSGWRWAY